MSVQEGVSKGVSAQGEGVVCLGGVCPGGGYLPRGVCSGEGVSAQGRGCLLRGGGVYPGGVCLGGVCPGGGGVCLRGCTPPLDRWTLVKTLPFSNYCCGR